MQAIESGESYDSICETHFEQGEGLSGVASLIALAILLFLSRGNRCLILFRRKAALGSFTGCGRTKEMLRRAGWQTTRAICTEQRCCSAARRSTWHVSMPRYQPRRRTCVMAAAAIWTFCCPVTAELTIWSVFTGINVFSVDLLYLQHDMSKFSQTICKICAKYAQYAKSVLVESIWKTSNMQQYI